jgi:hypothetical protein
LQRTVEQAARENRERQGDSSDGQEGSVERLVLGGASGVREQPPDIQQGRQGTGQAGLPAADGGRVDHRDEQEDRGGR